MPLPDIAFVTPHCLWLALLLPLVWWRPGRTTVAHRALRTAIFACIVAALAQPALIRRTTTARQVILLDQRDTLSPAARSRARSVLRQLLAAPGQRATLIQLGGTPVPARVERRITLAPGAASASLSAAMARALAAVPLGDGASVRIISDGLSRDRHWGRVIDGFVRRGIAVDTVALDMAPRAPFISDIAIAPVRTGETARATVTVDGNGRGRRIALYTGDRLLARSAPFDVAGSIHVPIPFPAGTAGFLPVRAVLDGHADGLASVVAVQPPLPVLYVGADGGAGRLRQLLGAGFAVDGRTPATISRTTDLARYRAVMLDDVPPARLGADVQRRLADAVTTGGTGLIHTGGDPAFDHAGAAPLATLLPVVPRPEEKVQRPSVALAIVIDSSGSMQGNPLEIAKQIARVTVRKLGPADSIGVVEFYGAKQWAVPMQPARSIPDVERAIGRMQANGQSVLYPAIEEAYYALRGVDARFKHILIISDAGVEEQRYQQLLRHIADDRINVSTALVGTDVEGEDRMASWARWGQGRFYSVPDETSLVEMDFKTPEIKPSPGFRSGDFALVTRDGGWWRDRVPATPPPIGGYARTTARPAAQTLVATATGDPLLASWAVGNGRVTALMTQPLGAGTARWAAWPRYGEWLGRIVARTANQQPAVDLKLARDGDRITVVAQRLGRERPAPPAVRLLDPAMRGAEVPLEEKAPGLFVGVAPLASARPALVELRDGDEVVRAADRPGSDVAPPDALPLEDALPMARLSAMTGGRAIDATATPPAPRGNGGDAATPLWSWMSLLALLLYLGELLYRRWPARRSHA